MTAAQEVYNQVRIDTFIEAVAEWFDSDQKLMAYERALLVTLARHEQSSGPTAQRGHGWIAEAIQEIADQLTAEDPHADPETVAPNAAELRRIVNHAVERGHITGKPWNFPGSSIDWSDLRITAVGTDLVAAGFAEPPDLAGVNVHVGDNFTGDLAVGGNDAHVGDQITVTFTLAAADETLVAVLHRIADLLDDAQEAAVARNIADDPDPVSRRQRAKTWLGALTVNTAASGLVETAFAIAEAI